MNDLSELIAALRQYTATTQKLIESNAALIQAMAESEGVDDEMGGDSYLDGDTLD